MPHEPIDQEAEGNKIRAGLRLMRKNFDSGCYEGEEQVYWRKIISLKEQLVSIQYIPESAMIKAARTLLELQDSWELKQCVSVKISCN
jgi:hypothetical protein